MSRVEILSPAGSPVSLHAAVNAGADAVYVGGNMFSARAFANNFDSKELQEALDFVHIHNKKLYLTVNTLLKNSELKGYLYDFIKLAYENGLDAVLVQDFGVFEFIKANFPDLDIHASTQMTTNSEYSARLLEQKGVTRVVTSREVSLEEIRRIRSTTDIEIESFVHGALCYSYSGQCLMSSMIGGRSGNRGRCAQSCRLAYTVYDGNNKICGVKNCHALSPKDICTLEILPDIIEAGVNSLKIEGRMKSPQYTAGVVSIYRKYVDMYLNNGKKDYVTDEQDIMDLMDLFNRGNFTKGYYVMKNGKQMMSMERPNHQGTRAVEVVSAQKGKMTVRALNKLNPQDIVDVSPDFTWTNGTDRSVNEVFDIRIPAALRVSKGDVYYRVRNNRLLNSIQDRFIERDAKVDIGIEGEFKAGSPSRVTLSCRDSKVSVCGNVVSTADNRPVTCEQIKEQLSKLGNTQFRASGVDLNVQEGIFVPVQELKALRRAAVDKLREALVKRRTISGNRRDLQPEDITDEQIKPVKPYISVLIRNKEQLERAADFSEIDRIYYEFSDGDFESLKDISEKIKSYGFEFILALPHIFRKSAANLFLADIDKLKNAGADGFLIRSLDELQFVIENNLSGKRILDYNLYRFNDYSESFFKPYNIDTFTASYELSRNEIFNMDNKNTELVVYGRIPLMLSAQCVMKNFKGCRESEGMLYIKDRVGKYMPVENRCRWCYNIIYDSAPLNLTEYATIINENNFKSLRIDLTIEKAEDITPIINNVCENFVRGKFTKPAADYTKGHFLRGVE